ncbi:unnamed protein product [Linum trigynum]|uniref:Uncharacterized protein n=1 Tax=Linum trigynum TaxID=586398 RepID=A0AAV2E821_9ROSI
MAGPSSLSSIEGHHSLNASFNDNIKLLLAKVTEMQDGLIEFRDSPTYRGNRSVCPAPPAADYCGILNKQSAPTSSELDGGRGMVGNPLPVLSMETGRDRSVPLLILENQPPTARRNVELKVPTATSLSPAAASFPTGIPDQLIHCRQRQV